MSFGKQIGMHELTERENYSKEYGKKKMKVRKEVQEYPNKSLKYAVMDKLYNKSKAIGGF